MGTNDHKDAPQWRFLKWLTGLSTRFLKLLTDFSTRFLKWLINLLHSAEFWTAVVALLVVVLAKTDPEWRETLVELKEPVTALILALLGKSAVTSFAAISKGKERLWGQWK